MPNRFRVAFATIALGAVFGSAHALDIVINAGANLAGNGAALASFNRAAAKWEAIFADPITVTIAADLQSMGGGVLGSANSVILFNNYSVIRNQMVADAADEASNSIVSFLPTSGQFSGLLPAGFAFDGNMQATKANLKAMGVAGLDGTFGVNDASITFNSDFAFNFNDVPPGGGQVDFETVAIHEIGHAMGFISETDFVDFVLPGTSSQIRPAALDLFIFRDQDVPTTNAQFTNNPRSFVPGQAKKFSDTVNSWSMSTGVDFGDGNQASHWKDNLGIGIMDPTLGFGEEGDPTFADIRALDLIGWDMVQPVPEPATMVVLGLGAAAVLRRRKKSAK